MKNSSGFTFFEILVVLGLVGLIAAGVLAQVSNAQARQRDQKRIADITTVKSAIDLYIADNGGPPGTNFDASGNPSGACVPGPGGTYTVTLDLLRTNGYLERLPSPPPQPTGWVYTYQCRQSAGQLQYYISTPLERGSSVAAQDSCPSTNRTLELKRPTTIAGWGGC
ncbi:MAG: prepilin-type N-terminal cleavage/methylation domain-containing protein [Parcubacteria group bacterium]|nr:prepilin-type N-terminal cleavage/methylation domain-containing protein [Parcubacteria group bacterium]